MPIKLRDGNFTLLVIHIYKAQLDEICQAIEKKIKQAPNFFKNAPVVINISDLDGDFSKKVLLQVMLNTNLRIIGISGCNNNKLKQLVICSGLALLTEKKALKVHNNADTSANANFISMNSTLKKTRFISTPIRSGQQIYAKDSDLIVTNNVSVGAELIADGNIHIYGIMRGRALAGALGDQDCQIFCTHLFPELVSIAGQYWLGDQIPTTFLGKAARLCLRHGNVFDIYPLI
ncbi:septum site-determining protein MinC [Sodalis sp. CWE]|uniref:septum site-determining protein MinC n=1 Tax=Sodalis sp. CWE TaxID=2803816 RepID=UPI0021068EB7|nr:septum site-determining protein MinC [Sodalis sp. CWE]